MPGQTGPHSLCIPHFSTWLPAACSGYAFSAKLHLPLSHRRICIYHPFPSRIFSHMCGRARELCFMEKTFDITLSATLPCSMSRAI
jgi:hypothetical protein